VLIGAPSALRAAVALQLNAAAALLACLDAPACLAPALRPGPAGGGTGLSGATLVLATVPQLPGLATRLRHRFRAPTLAGEFEQAVTQAREHGAACSGPPGRSPTTRPAASPDGARTAPPPPGASPACSNQSQGCVHWLPTPRTQRAKQAPDQARRAGLEPAPRC